MTRNKKDGDPLLERGRLTKTLPVAVSTITDQPFEPPLYSKKAGSVV